MNKKEIRNAITEKKLHISYNEIIEKSNIIMDKLINTKEYKESNTLFSYVSFNQEVISKDLLKESLGSKKIAVPKITGGKMKFYYIHSLEDLEPGFFGILEPTTRQEALPTRHDLFLVPGLAFDKKKNRIGYGKGYYDQYFNKYSKIEIKKIAVAFDFQIYDLIPTTKKDIPMDKIITPTRIIQ